MALHGFHQQWACGFVLRGQHGFDNTNHTPLRLLYWLLNNQYYRLSPSLHRGDFLHPANQTEACNCQFQ